MTPRPDTSTSDLPAALADRYRDPTLLGEGGFGRVLRASDRELGRQVAIKLLLDVAGDPAAAARFAREARLAAQVRHPHVVQVFDHGTAPDGTAWIVYELVEGRDLGHLVAERPGPSPEQVASWGADLASALAACHRLGVVHRDVKPANVFLRATGEVALGDFGIARELSPRTRLTAEGLVLGTPGFMAPELWLGGEPTAASDQFALAMSLVALRSGRVLVEAGDIPAHLEWAKRRGPPELPPPHPVTPLDRRLCEVLVRALAPRPEARFPDLDTMAGALREACRAQPATSELATSAALPDPGRPALLPTRQVASPGSHRAPEGAPTSQVDPGPAGRPLPRALPRPLALLLALAMGLLVRSHWRTPAPAREPGVPPAPAGPELVPGAGDEARIEALRTAVEDLARAHVGSAGRFFEVADRDYPEHAAATLADPEGLRLQYRDLLQLLAQAHRPFTVPGDPPSATATRLVLTATDLVRHVLRDVIDANGMSREALRRSLLGMTPETPGKRELDADHHAAELDLQQATEEFLQGLPRVPAPPGSPLSLVVRARFAVMVKAASRNSDLPLLCGLLAEDPVGPLADAAEDALAEMLDLQAPPALACRDLELAIGALAIRVGTIPPASHHPSEAARVLRGARALARFALRCGGSREAGEPGRFLLSSYRAFSVATPDLMGGLLPPELVHPPEEHLADPVFQALRDLKLTVALDRLKDVAAFRLAAPAPLPPGQDRVLAGVLDGIDTLVARDRTAADLLEAAAGALTTGPWAGDSWLQIAIPLAGLAGVALWSTDPDRSGDPRLGKAASRLADLLRANASDHTPELVDRFLREAEAIVETWTGDPRFAALATGLPAGLRNRRRLAHLRCVLEDSNLEGLLGRSLSVLGRELPGGERQALARRLLEEVDAAGTSSRWSRRDAFGQVLLATVAVETDRPSPSDLTRLSHRIDALVALAPDPWSLLEPLATELSVRHRDGPGARLLADLPARIRDRRR